MVDEKLVYPNLIFLDGVPSKKLGGISQTLYNLFDSYPIEKLYALADDTQHNEIDNGSLNCTTIHINNTRFSHIRKRYISKLNPTIDKLNAVTREIFGLGIQTNKLPADALLLVCTTDINKLHAAKLIHQKYKYPMLTYFMDDWTADLKFNWWLGNIDELVKFTLDRALGRLMISEWLNESLTERYSLSQKPTYVVHNPVTITRTFVKPESITAVDVVKIIYAGSIWDMHLDALVLVVNAIEKLNQTATQKYELMIYSKVDFWERNRDKLDKPGVVFGGFVLYDELDAKLSKANLLLVTSSFAKQFEAFSRSSVQTKLTDYMKTGIPVLTVGPEYGACNKFVDKWQCGYVWRNSNTEQLSQFLKEIALDDTTYQQYAENAYKAVEDHFSKSVVQNKLMQFIGNL